ncbi:hypothetical protein HYX04_05220 [Candidatus Woesearchaeota archaeon]|nr:hypothetical protein [Candidatus Woesearchaeota archaeon]
MSTAKKALMVFVVFLCLLSFVYAQDYDYSLFSGKFYDAKEGLEKIEFELNNGTYNICGHEDKQLPILVVNKGSVGNKYKLQASGVGWASLNAQEFSLPGKQSGVVLLELKPGQNTIGNYKIQVNGLSSAGNVKRELLLDISVERCRSLKLELGKEEDKVCGGIKKQYSGEITNAGEQEIDVELSLKGPNWISLDKDIISVAANNTQYFRLNADVPANAKGIFDAIVSAIIKNMTIKEEKRLSIEVVPKYDCYKADALAEDAVSKSIDNAVLTKENKFLNGLKSFFVFYKFYLISGILISLLFIFLIEFHKPLLKLLKGTSKKK